MDRLFDGRFWGNLGNLVLVDVTVAVHPLMSCASRALADEPEALRLVRLNTRNVFHKALETQVIFVSHKSQNIRQLFVDFSFNLCVHNGHNLALH